MNEHAPLLRVENLSITLKTPSGEQVQPLRGVNFELSRGEALGIVGESGSGKSMSMLALMGLLPSNARRDADSLKLGDKDLLQIEDTTFAREIAGKRIGMIFQEPMTSLNPVYTIGRQLIETATLYGRGTARAARARAIELLNRVGVPEPELRLDQYPHQLSGGLRQRVMIAMALMNEPELIIADEPTTALDVTIKAQILDLLADLQSELGMGMILVSHDIGAVSRAVDRIGVMYAGAFVEKGPLDDVFEHPLHPYTQGLLQCAPRATLAHGGPRLGAIPGSVPSPFKRLTRCAFSDRCPHVHDACYGSEPALRSAGNQAYRCVLDAEQLQSDNDHSDKGVVIPHATPVQVEHGDPPVLALESASCVFTTRRGLLGRSKDNRAVDDVSIALHGNEILAIVGESGSGKTTTARMMLGLQQPTSGVALFRGEALEKSTPRQRAQLIQPVFQDPYSSLNPLRTVGDSIGRPLVVHGVGNRASRRERALEIMSLVGLPERFYNSYPNQMSGGQRQRVAIARALVLEPKVLICDEPTSALDISVQAQILNLLLDLRERLGLTYLLITHDLAVVRYFATRVVVMKSGQIVESGETERVYTQPTHPYTQELLASISDPLRRSA
ncbi:dipeptide ABC transporter ATP-binding protein [Salinicola corii]|uniref:ABC-type dipeptide transporter n=1 Tax=Salinicola corii TaxID=2606937 RepID=A0A640WF05_9GAMM|nr:ABC transporter ATP-binding protein [Salinicola corii]KAA0018716.1 dipeptide ABC transporter ATP-binding protein [Salinicola corii]